MGEVHDRHGAARAHVHAQCGHIKGAKDFECGNAIWPVFRNKAFVPVKRDRAVLCDQAGTILWRGPQAFDKVDGDGIIVVKPELHRSHVLVAGGVQDFLHHLTVRARRFCVNAGLGQVSGDVVQAVEMLLGHRVTDHNHQLEIGVCLRL